VPVRADRRRPQGWLPLARLPPSNEHDVQVKHRAEINAKHDHQCAYLTLAGQGIRAP
jgi:hypothetical protein